jgi:NADH-quinone oxidoreductase subunit N
MNATDIIALLPVIIAAAIPVALLLELTIYRSHRISLFITLVGLATAFKSLWIVYPRSPRQVTALLIIDGYSLFYMGLIFAAALIVALLSYGYLEKHRTRPEEFYLLLSLATFGSAILAASTHFASFFLGLEILSVSLYAMVAYLRENINMKGVEAGIKYLILAGTSSAFLLFGMALLYSELGTMEFARIASLPPPAGEASTLIYLTAMVLIVVGIGFKLALVPFHLWTPDVYQGAPAPVTAFVATVSKGAMFALLLRFFGQIHLQQFNALVLIFTVIAIASMFVGNLLALLQNNVKRLLAYSSIAHLGYLLVAFLAGGTLAVTTVAFYLVAYFVTTLGAFGVITVLSNKDREAEVLEDYRGLAWRRPGLAGIFTAMLLSLAGIPLTAGFVGKFFILRAGAGTGLWLLVIILVINSAIGLYYYLRVIVWLYLRPVEGEGLPECQGLLLPITAGIALAILTILLLGFGIYPSPLIRVIQETAAASF